MRSSLQNQWLGEKFEQNVDEKGLSEMEKNTGVRIHHFWRGGGTREGRTVGGGLVTLMYT